ncbi:MAG: hypothetical protein COA78_24640 [Blastopirellula sp.]|nr:MAG: hypothetical protein COA78_24640 [Blastopirellula sp.]
MTTNNFGISGSEGFLRHLSGEHQAIDHELKAVEGTFERTDPAHSTVEFSKLLATRMNRLKEVLRKHFCEEEGIGCLEEAVARRPRLSHQATLLGQEHGELMADLNRLIEAVEHEPEDDEKLIELKKTFDHFVEMVKLYESNESLLVRRGLNAVLEDV